MLFRGSNIQTKIGRGIRRNCVSGCAFSLSHGKEPLLINRGRCGVEGDELYEALLGTQEQEAPEDEAVHYYMEVICG